MTNKNKCLKIIEIVMKVLKKIQLDNKLVTLHNTLCMTDECSLYKRNLFVIIWLIFSLGS